MAAIPATLITALQDRYQLERELGHGGMATVYLAHDVRHDRDVALKVLRPELAVVLGRERFLAEIRLTAKLDHPHILTLIDSGESDGFLWYAIPYVRGESLRHKLERERQVGIDEALAIARQIAGALDHAHRHGVIHRDVKPENILLHEGEAMLADFGIALAVRAAAGERLTETGLSVGTPRYMSPEQATAERQLDARSDVYSLGTVLYEMLAGEPPFSGATGQAVIAKLMTERPTRLRTIRDTVPESVDVAVLRALAKVPADRFASAAEFGAALDASAQRVAAPLHVGRKALAWGAASVLVLTGAAFAVQALRPTASARGAVPDPNRVVVLPFENRTGDPADDDLGARAAEWIVAAIWRDAREWVEPVPMAKVRGQVGRRQQTSGQVAQVVGAGFSISGAYFKRGDSLELRAEIRDGVTDKVLTILEPVVAPRGATGGFTFLADRAAAAIGTLGLGRSLQEQWEHGSVATNIEALRALQTFNLATMRQDWGAAIGAAQEAAAHDTLWFRPVDALMAAYYNAGQTRQLDSLRRAWKPRRFQLLPFDLARFDLNTGYDEDQELAYRASMTLMAYDSGHANAYQAAMMAQVTNRPRTTLKILPLRLRDTTERARMWSAWADIEAWAHHVLGDHEVELAAVRQWRTALPRDPMVREHEASALAALGQVTSLPLLADSVLLVQPDGWYYPNVGIIPGIIALEARAHGYPEQAPALFDKALAWFEARITDPTATLRARFEHAQVLSWAGRDREAQTQLQRLLVTAPDSARYLGQLGVVAVRLGNHQLAARMDQRLATLTIPLLYNLNALWRANIAAAGGGCAKAVDLLRQALLHGQHYSLDLHRMPYYAPIRDCPAFRELLKPRD